VCRSATVSRRLLNLTIIFRTVAYRLGVFGSARSGSDFFQNIENAEINLFAGTTMILFRSAFFGYIRREITIRWAKQPLPRMEDRVTLDAVSDKNRAAYPSGGW
jgi:hypothetical protein